MKESKEMNKPNLVKSPYQPEQKGVPVEEGKNWVTGLTLEQRKQFFHDHENKWKRRYNANRGTMQNFSRG